MKVTYNCPQCNTTSQDVPVIYSRVGNEEINRNARKKVEEHEKQQKEDKLVEEATRDFRLVTHYSTKISPKEFLKYNYPKLFNLYYDSDTFDPPYSFGVVHFRNGEFINQHPFFSYRYLPYSYTHTITCPVCEREERIYRRKNAR